MKKVQQVGGYWMESNGFYVGLNTPPAVTGRGINGLPPYMKTFGYLVDEYEQAPSNWMRSEGKMASYFTGVKEDSGMWLDFNRNNNHTHDIAIVISVQGVNPITGLPCGDPQLEQYIETCPKCKKKFSGNRYCESCEYTWPKQNYISTTGNPKGQLWLDGFKSAEGVVRQYILTMEKMKGVAGHITGGNQVYAIGVSFFISKKKKDVGIRLGSDRSLSIMTTPAFYSSNLYKDGAKGTDTGYTPSKWLSTNNDTSYDTTTTCDSDGPCLDGLDLIKCSSSSAPEANSAGENIAAYSAFRGMDIQRCREPQKKSRQTSLSGKKLEVGAGSKINQKTYDDPNGLEFWKDVPEALICVNYCVEEDADFILNNGRVAREEKEEGFLSGIPLI